MKHDKIKQFSSTILRRESNAVFREIEEKGIARITHRDRDDMLLIKEKDIDSVIKMFCSTRENEF